MITRIARKEMIEMLRDGRFRLTAGIVLALLLAALALGWQHYREVRAQQQAAQSADREQWLQQGERNPHVAAHFGSYAFKPSPPLSFVDRGIESYTGIAVWMEAHNQDSFQYRPVEDNTTAGGFGELTAAMVLQLLVPLLIILLTFSSFAGERETGTLRQLLSLGVKRRDLALGKAGGIATALLLLLFPAAVIGALALSLASSSDAVMFSAGRCASMTVAYLLYFGAFLGISLAVSARSRSSRAALIALLGFWIVNGLVAPRLAADVSERLYPVPSSFEFWRAVNRDKREGINGHDPSNSRNEELKLRVLAQYNVTRIEELPVNFDGIALQAGEEYGNEVFDKHYRHLWQSYEQQNRVHQAGEFIAPLLSVRSVSMALAGTDWTQHQHFSVAAETYRRALVKMMNDDLTYNSRTGQYNHVGDHHLWEQVPPFEYRAPRLARVIAEQVWSLSLLFLWFAAAVAAAIAAVIKMKVELS